MIFLDKNLAPSLQPLSDYDEKNAYNIVMALPSFSTFGEMLKFLRRRARLTQKDLSIAVGYSESHISRLERNERPPDTATLAALFVSALRLEKEPKLVAQMIELATTARGRNFPKVTLHISRLSCRVRMQFPIFLQLPHPPISPSP
jgi:transcriptional regulator with XRE-family HTH domain